MGRAPMLPGCEEQAARRCRGIHNISARFARQIRRVQLCRCTRRLPAMRIVPALVYAVLGAGALAGGGWVKLLGFEVDPATGKWTELSGVNITLGLPIIRT